MTEQSVYVCHSLFIYNGKLLFDIVSIEVQYQKSMVTRAISKKAFSFGTHVILNIMPPFSQILMLE